MKRRWLIFCFLLILFCTILTWYYGFFDKRVIVGNNVFRFRGLDQVSAEIVNQDELKQYVYDIETTTKKKNVIFKFIPQMPANNGNTFDLVWQGSILGESGIAYKSFNTKDLFGERTIITFYITTQSLKDSFESPEAFTEILNRFFRAAVFESLAGKIGDSSENASKYKSLEKIYEKTVMVDFL